MKVCSIWKTYTEQASCVIMASLVDNLVADVRKVSAEGEWKELAVKLNQCGDQLSKVDLPVLDTMIECLEIPTHSLGVMAAL